MTVNDGKVHGWCLDANDSEHVCQLLSELFQHYRPVRRLHLIWDNGPSHVSETTRSFLRDYPTLVTRVAHTRARVVAEPVRITPARLWRMLAET